LTIPAPQIDADPWLLAFRNGKVMDLRTRSIRPICPDDILMKSVNADYDPGASCPTWKRFLSQITNEDAGLEALFSGQAGIP
jgi:putative DNA primase/helicase